GVALSWVFPTEKLRFPMGCLGCLLGIAGLGEVLVELDGLFFMRHGLPSRVHRLGPCQQSQTHERDNEHSSQAEPALPGSSESLIVQTHTGHGSDNGPAQMR